MAIWLYFTDLDFLLRPSVPPSGCPSVLAVHGPPSVKRISGLIILFLPSVHAFKAVVGFLDSKITRNRIQNAQVGRTRT